jgi:endonuclease-3
LEKGLGSITKAQASHFSSRIAVAGAAAILLSTMPRKPKRKAPASPARHYTSPEPYPSHASPSSTQCLAVRDALLAFHGFPEEFAPFRLLRLGGRSPNRDPRPQPLSPTVLDGLVITLLSQNTTDAISRRAFASLKAAFPSWDQVSY